ncbi:hypothetical protein P4H27_26030 [Paenibacillus taichungensis]|uniref:hypothetical protein n=1 Tax=Paenibacillus taichungensis TaxID=484184 RepID=UPI002DB5F8C1|nr:hypothetical protein [Paenibacillus taichungensis]MEC0110433.1 hypothetical protein [Paenibacillus taichungensis]MEC0200109.1 hypothetical protein [Paenibacillus taichungensis]
MRIKIINSSPGLSDISQLVGKEFEVTSQDAAGIYIGYGPTGQYLIHESEYEVVEGRDEA